MEADLSSKDRTSKLRQAVEKLAAFVSEQDRTASYSLSDTLASMQALFTPLTNRRYDFHANYQGKLSEAVEQILRERLLIQQLQQGTEEEKALAASLKQTIEAYNKSCDERIQKQSLGIFGFFSAMTAGWATESKQKISLPPQITVKYHYPEETTPESIRHALTSTALASAAILLPQRLIEMFQMKALTLLEENKIATNAEARAHVKQSPIAVKAIPEDECCSLTQTLTLFPGQTITIKGDFSFNAKTQTFGLPKTFRMTQELTQTGFPDPAQRAGWALAFSFIPGSPQRIDLLNRTRKLFSSKSEAVQNLLKGGEWIQKAKLLLNGKEAAFNQHSHTFINLHHRLAAALTASSEEKDHEDEGLLLKRFFSALREHPHPYRTLVATHQMIANKFLIEPYHALLNGILKGKATDFGSLDEKDRFYACQRLLNAQVDEAINDVHNQFDIGKSEWERLQLSFIRKVGSILGRGATNIILQHLSEDLIFAPPTLTDFESKLQEVAYHQLEDFLQELASPPKEMAASLHQALSDDIALFEGDRLLPISTELAHYFQKRYNSLALSS